MRSAGAVAFDSAIRRATVCCSAVSSLTSTSPLAPASPRWGSRRGALARVGRRRGSRRRPAPASARRPPRRRPSRFARRARSLEPSELHVQLARHPPRDRRSLDARRRRCRCALVASRCRPAHRRGLVCLAPPGSPLYRLSPARLRPPASSPASPSPRLGLFPLRGFSPASSVADARDHLADRQACRPPAPRSRSARPRCRPRRSCWPCRSRSRRSRRRA